MEPFIAEIIMFGGNFEPRGWAYCNGQVLDINQNAALFSLLGTTYGGDGRTIFALPDMRGRVAIHPGNGNGVSSYRLGQKGGVESVTLNVMQIPQHHHVAQIGVTEEDANSEEPNGNVLAVSGVGEIFATGSAQNGKVLGGSMNTTSVGGNQSHTNIQPFLCVNHIIALQGIFPSRS